MTAASLPLIAVTGLSAEARIASAKGVVTLSGGGDRTRLALLLQAALEGGASAVISFGIAGGLEPGLAPGATIIAGQIDDGGVTITTDAGWRARLAEALPQARIADLVGVDAPMCTVEAKRDAHRRTGAAAVDMESHVAARLAAIYHVPFAALRVVADPAERTIPEAAAVGMRPDGSTDIGAVLKALARRPGDLPALIRTALDARAAFSSLARNRRLLCARLGFTPAVTHPVFELAQTDHGLAIPAEAS